MWTWDRRDTKFEKKMPHLLDSSFQKFKGNIIILKYDENYCNINLTVFFKIIIIILN